ncbi:hypothetical protein B0E42_19750 [Pseudomonas sp. A25(2017)]|nr:hypothetical protein B0E42_19750 [Pseudomonas sp. A25(2017)]
MWERACSRKRSGIQNQCKLTRRLREQARSHRWRLRYPNQTPSRLTLARNVSVLGIFSPTSLAR